MGCEIAFLAERIIGIRNDGMLKTSVFIASLSFRIPNSEFRIRQLHAQICVYEAVYFAVHYCVYVAAFVSCAVVFYQGVGHKHV